MLPNYSLQGVCQFLLPVAMQEGECLCLPAHQESLFSNFWIFALSNKFLKINVFLFCIFLNMIDIEHVFICLKKQVYFLQTVLTPAHHSIGFWSFVSSSHQFAGALYIVLGKLALCDMSYIQLSFCHLLIDFALGVFKTQFGSSHAEVFDFHVLKIVNHLFCGFQILSHSKTFLISHFCFSIFMFFSVYI